ncbi:ankyrin repeat domain-containing protein 2 [Oncorhynchus tshawytscha]|uniref:ankyrin repeat domain-containing protein 2 n=1 Tax=Oncorhynchus tshawytscha TaxID=74940 RepID=UPI001C3D39E6|nr:ankyrin repeat domain-containing protein 2 [Oncorhynchus tshawytscha]
MEEDVQWATNVTAEQDLKKSERRRARAVKLGRMKWDTPEQEEPGCEPTNHNVESIQPEERERNSFSEGKIVDQGGPESIKEICRRRKLKKAGSSSKVAMDIPVLGPVDTFDFMKAATQGKLKVVEKYLEDGGDPNFSDQLRRTALHFASIEGHSTIIQKLLEKGANINSKDRLESRAVHWACRGGSLAVIEVLQKHGADLNIRDKLMASPLHVATRTGHSDVVGHLLNSGAKINARDREGDTPLHDAVRLGRYKILKLLIVGGADTRLKNHEGFTAVEQVKEWQFDTKETLEKLDQLREVGLVPPLVPNLPDHQISLQP